MLGARFDLRGFHGEVVKNGAIPLDALEAEVKSWVEAGGSAPGATAGATVQ
jgi:uncharacterized protein (DUF885 family)